MSSPTIFSSTEDAHFRISTEYYSPTFSENSTRNKNISIISIIAEEPMILQYVSIALSLMALIGNSLIFAVFSMKYYKKSLTAMMYRILALADGLVVLMHDGLHTVSYVINGTSIPGYNTTTCKTFIFMLLWIRAFSVWLLVIISIQRFIGIRWPHRAKFLNTKLKYMGFTCILLSVTFVLYMPLTLTVDHAFIEVDDQKLPICEVLGEPENREDHLKWYRGMFDRMNLVVCGFLPFILVSVSNIAVKRKTFFMMVLPGNSDVRGCFGQILATSVR